MYVADPRSLVLLHNARLCRMQPPLMSFSLAVAARHCVAQAGPLAADSIPREETH